MEGWAQAVSYARDTLKKGESEEEPRAQEERKDIPGRQYSL